MLLQLRSTLPRIFTVGGRGGDVGRRHRGTACWWWTPSGLNLGRHLGQFGTFTMVAGNRPNTSIAVYIYTYIYEYMFEVYISRKDESSHLAQNITEMRKKMLEVLTWHRI